MFLGEIKRSIYIYIYIYIEVEQTCILCSSCYLIGMLHLSTFYFFNVICLKCREGLYYLFLFWLFGLLCLYNHASMCLLLLFMIELY